MKRKREKTIRGCRYMQNECVGVSQPMVHPRCEFDEENKVCSTQKQKATTSTGKKVVTKVKPKRLRDPKKKLEIQDANFVSGPVSSYYFEWKGTKFFLFGDIHRSKENNCDDLQSSQEFQDLSPEPCLKTLDGDSEEIANCYNLVTFIEKIARDAGKNHKKVDMYLELAYKEAETREFTDVELERFARTDNIGSIVQFFKECFTRDKTGCPYDSDVHFHYADIRQTFGEGLILPELNLFTTITSFIGSIQDALQMMEALTQRGVSQKEAMDHVWNKNMRTTVSTLIDDINANVHAFFDKDVTMKGETPSIVKQIWDAIKSSEEFTQDIQRILFDFKQKMHDNLDKQLQDYNMGEQEKIAIKKQSDKLYLQMMSKWLKILKVVSNNEHRVAKSVRKLDNEMPKESKVLKNFIENLEKQVIQSMRQKFVLVWDRWYKNMMKLLRVKKITGIQTMHEFSVLQDITKMKDIIKSQKDFLGLTIMDNYLLSRLLYQMSQRKTDIVIIYAGAAHIENYIDFFENHIRVMPIMEHYPQKNANLISELRRGITEVLRDPKDILNAQRCVRTKYPFH